MFIKKGCFSVLKDSNHDDFLQFYATISKFDEQLTENYKKDAPTWSSPITCHHARAVDFYIENKQRICQRVAYKCDLYKNYLKGHCAKCGDKNENCILFEYNANNNLDMPSIKNQSYFLESNPSEPFCAHHYRIEIKIDSSNFKYGVLELTVNGEQDSELFELKGDWNVSSFTLVATTNKFLGNLQNATGEFKKSWFERHEKKIEFLSMKMNYMSNMNFRIREKLSAQFLPRPIKDDLVIFLSLS